MPDRPGLGTVSAPRGQRLGTILRKGLLVTSTCARACRAEISVYPSHATARRYRLRRGKALIRVGYRTAATRGKATVRNRVKLSARARKALRRARRGGLILRIRLSETSAKPLTIRNQITVRR